MHSKLNSIWLDWRAKVPNGVPNPSNDYHLVLLKELCLEQGIDTQIIDDVILVLEKTSTVAQDAKKAGLQSLGGGYYSKSGKKPATHKSSDGKLVGLGKKDVAKKKEKPKGVGVFDKPKEKPQSTEKRIIAGKDKTLTQVDSKTEKEVFDSDVSPDDEEFQKKNKNFRGRDISNPPPPYELPDEIKNLSPKVPKKYIQMIERMINTQRVDDFNPSISHFIDEKGAGRISAQAGEIVSLVAVGMNDEQAKIFLESMNEHLSDPDRPKKQVLDKSWIKAAINNRKAIYNRLKKKYPDINLPDDINHTAWDTKTDVEALGLSDYEKNKGFSTDIYISINTPDGTILDEISLKKDKNVNFLNSGTGKFSQWDPDLPDEINQAVYKTNQRKVLVNAVEKLLGDKVNSDPKLKKAFEETKAGKGSRTKSKLLKVALEELGTDEAQSVLDKMNEDRAIFESKAVQAVIKEPLKAQMLKEIASEFPLKGVSDEEESMAIGDMSLDKITMKEIFGTDDYDDIKENLVAEVGEDGKPYLGYRAEVGEDVIPIAEIKIREDGVNYGGQFKFEMTLHKVFAKKLKESNEKIY